MHLPLSEIEAAAERIRGHIDATPFRRSRRLSEATGAEVFIKFENLHYTGSFKERGARNRLSQLSEGERQRGVVAASAGNHASALAYHGRRLGVPVTIVMPQSTPFVKIERTRDFGAEVVLEGTGFDDATEHALRLRDARGLVFVSAFDDVGVICGQGTCGLEMARQEPDLDAILAPIGGGGLIAGVAAGARGVNPDIRIFGVEAAMYPSFAARRRGEKAQCGGQTLAEGIAVKAVGDIPFAIADPLVEDVVVVEESDFERAVAMFCNLEKTVAEGAGAGGLAALLREPDRFRGKKVGLVLCGGNIDPRLLASVLYREMVRESRMVTVRIIADDRPGVLGRMSSIIGSVGGNIIDVVHERLTLEIPAKGAEFDIVVETRDAQHADEIRDALKENGFALKS